MDLELTLEADEFSDCDSHATIKHKKRPKITYEIMRNISKWFEAKLA